MCFEGLELFRIFFHVPWTVKHCLDGRPSLGVQQYWVDPHIMSGCNK